MQAMRVWYFPFKEQLPRNVQHRRAILKGYCQINILQVEFLANLAFYVLKVQREDVYLHEKYMPELHSTLCRQFIEQIRMYNYVGKQSWANNPLNIEISAVR
jgi:hypothetical protein